MQTKTDQQTIIGGSMNTSSLTRKLCFTAKSFAALLLICAGSIAFAQQVTGTILGTVQDPQGNVVNTASVKATNVETGFSRSASSNGVGEYRIDYLPVGKYTLEATAPTFERFVQKNIALDVEQELTVNISLVVGAQTSTVTVTEAPPQINTADAVLGRTIEPDEILGLPLVNRNAYTELSLTPGIMANSASDITNSGGTPNMTVGLPSETVQVNGGLDSGNGTVGFYLDGGNNITGMRNYGNQAPSPDAIDEERVETNAFEAQYGEFSGAVVSVVTKSGTNKFHGSLFESNRNTVLNAFSWAKVVNPFPQFGGPLLKAPYHRNQFGGTVGGPIRHDKAFFFFSYAGLRQVQGTPVTGATVPLAAERLGDFTFASTGDTFTVYNPKPSGTSSTVWDVPANQVDGHNTSPGCAAVATPNCMNTTAIANPNNPGGFYAYLDPVASNFDNIHNTFGVSVPLSASGTLEPSSGGQQITQIYVTPTTDNEYLGKYDENIGSKDHVSVDYFYIHTASTPSGGGNINWTGDQSAAAQTNANVSDVHTFGPSTANQTWISFTRAMGGRVLLPVTGPASQTLTTFGSNFQLQGPASLPSIVVGSGFNTGTPNAGPVTGSDNTELRDVFSMTKGKHNLAIGGEFGLDTTMFLADLNDYGDLTTASGSPTSTNNGIADWVAGQLSAFEQDAPYTTHISTWHTAAFVQDNYRLTPRFTANLGLRWDIDTAPVDSRNRTDSFVVSLQQSTVSPNAPKGMLFPGDSGIGRGIISTPYSHISPRVGFAWDPFGDGKTSIRAAAGIFWGNFSGNEWNQPGNAMPFSLRNGFGNETSIANIYNVGFPSTAPGGGVFPYVYSAAAPKFFPSQSIESITPSMKQSRIYQFNFSVQRQLPARVSMQVAYVGTLGRDLNAFIDANYAPDVNGTNPVNAQGNPLVGALNSTAGSYEQRRQFDGGPNLSAGTINAITLLIPGQTSNYNSLQVSATKTLSGGFSVSGFYVWSHALESMEPVENGASSAQDWGYLGKPFTASNNLMGALGGGLGRIGGEYGDMNSNHDSNAAINGTWNISYLHGSNKIVQEVANGWSISSIAYFTSGGPFSVATGTNQNNDSQGSSRPDYVVGGPSPKLPPHRCRVCSATGTNSVLTAWFNNSSATPTYTYNGNSHSSTAVPGIGGIGPQGADGNVSRNSLIGPGLKDMDAAIFRTINFERGVAFTFRADFTNVMNWVNLANPSASGPPPLVGMANKSGTFGVITGTTGPQRIIQLGGRLTF